MNRDQAAPHPISTKKIETVKDLLNSDCQMTIRCITIWTGYTFGTVLRIIHYELGMRRTVQDGAVLLSGSAP